jgi:hypothetical protein
MNRDGLCESWKDSLDLLAADSYQANIYRKIGGRLPELVAPACRSVKSQRPEWLRLYDEVL